ncbi:hypothetical protein CDD82_3215 [Ophiocordyceps australis]|uniref:AGC-kinase C-terminal domain-containing protein n=1 Tax=Ophiocordyceps australis TaxID=1399860 RepID=A0A2C5ZDI2_9HYPO|nr:hypothetical protein CDD82_3215 [Ophiocordyceps australis]
MPLVGGRFVFPDDGEDIKAHRWFKNFPWERINSITPPFIPHIRSMVDTHYFDESEPIADFSKSSCVQEGLPREQIRATLDEFRTTVQDLAMNFISVPFDSTRLRNADHEIDLATKLTVQERKMLKKFIRAYGRKERKRPRDILLRDESTKTIVMSERKRTAFMGYAWRRMRPEGYVVPAWTA